MTFDPECQNENRSGDSGWWLARLLRKPLSCSAIRRMASEAPAVPSTRATSPLAFGELPSLAEYCAEEGSGLTTATADRHGSDRKVKVVRVR